ncbi:hypothetical protein HKX48_000440 [Thoreauomyces humboldtii]|nr:hypothetical protein HKX48_000440 [Thoreauomyces humboldtii]
MTMHKLYMFRNQLTNRVLVSPTFRMPNTILNQIGEHRPEVTIRGDHWVPFAVLTGIRAPSTLSSLLSRVANPVQAQPNGQYRLPLPEVKRDPFAPARPKAEDPFALREREVVERRDPLRAWTVPTEVRDKMRALCRALIVDGEVRREMAEHVPLHDVDPATTLEGGGASSPLVDADLDTVPYTLWVERDQFRHLVEEQDDGLVWPEFVDHRRLRLVRNRYPDVPGFDMVALADQGHVVEEKQKRQTRWRRNRVLLQRR